jgi:hypothetical protein
MDADEVRCNWLVEGLYSGALPGIHGAMRALNKQFDCTNWKDISRVEYDGEKWGIGGCLDPEIKDEPGLGTADCLKHTHGNAGFFYNAVLGRRQVGC